MPTPAHRMGLPGSSDEISWPPVRAPKPVSIFYSGNTSYGYSYRIPVFDTVSNHYLELPYSTNNNIIRYNAAGTAQWTVTCANVNASATVWEALYFDLPENRLYVIASNNSSTFWFAWINVATGTVTAIGSPAPGFTNNYTGIVSNYLRRASPGSGDFIWYHWNTTALSAQKVTVNASSGAASGLTVHGFASWHATSKWAVTDDGAITYRFIGGAAYYSDGDVELVRGGAFLRVSLGAFSDMSIDGNDLVYGLPVGQYAALALLGGYSTIFFRPKVILDADLTAFLHRVADYQGMPA